MRSARLAAAQPYYIAFGDFITQPDLSQILKAKNRKSGSRKRGWKPHNNAATRKTLSKEGAGKR